MPSPAPSRTSPAAALKPLRVITRVFDEAVRVPGTPLRLGLDALLGLVPGAGDAVTAAIAAYALWVGVRLRAPASVLLRMLVNVGVDASLGAIPLVGDVFDVAWKANRRNLDLLERWVAAPGATQAASTAALAGVAAAVVVMLGGLIWLAVWGVKTLIRLVA